MSLVLMFFYWWAIPALVLLAAIALWRRAETPIRKGLIVALSAATLSGLLWLAEGEKWLLDWQVRELCAKDGGVRVYETVELPAEKFNQWGQPNFYKPNQGENALGAEYVFKQDTHYYKRGNPEMSRRLYQVFRRSGKKLLGEVVIYGRGGGDLPGPWHGSSFDCPDLAEGEISLFKAVFLQSDRRQK